MPKNHRNYQKTRHIALSGLLFALAMALSFIEGTLVIPGLLPGMKLGLANIVVMYALFFMGPRQALVLDVLKALFVFLVSGFTAEENIIIGNVALYGATSGKAFINGVAGERFCVRNSGAIAVVEGVGDHGCEYMTGGRVVVLGPTGKNFAAGMSGGIAYVLDENNDLYTKVNKDMVSSSEITSKYDVLELKDMIKEHVAYTNSEVGKKILDNFKEYLPKFKKIIPEDYERMMSTIIQMEEKGLSSEQAQIEAFYAATK